MAALVRIHPPLDNWLYDFGEYKEAFKILLFDFLQLWDDDIYFIKHIKKYPQNDHFYVELRPIKISDI